MPAKENFMANFKELIATLPYFKSWVDNAKNIISKGFTLHLFHIFQQKPQTP